MGGIGFWLGWWGLGCRLGRWGGGRRGGFGKLLVGLVGWGVGFKGGEIPGVADHEGHFFGCHGFGGDD